jgi:hypothetical protein
MRLRSVAPARGFLCSTGWRDLVFTQDPRRHIGSAGRHGELEEASRKLLQPHAVWGNLIDGTGNLINRRREMSIGHLDNRLTCLFHAVEDLLVLDLESVFPCASFPTICLNVLYSRE